MGFNPIEWSLESEFQMDRMDRNEISRRLGRPTFSRELLTFRTFRQMRRCQRTGRG
jgi:hypothetical protein